TDWGALKDRAAGYGVSPSALLLSVFTESLRTLSGSDSYTLIMTSANRPPPHPQIESLVGPCASTSLFDVRARAGRSFQELLRDNHEALRLSLEHGSVSGIRLVRELKARKRISGSMSLPVVFTSMLHLHGEVPASTDSRHSERLFANRPEYSVNLTPQIYLDHQVRERAGALELSWDVCPDYFGAAVADRMFAAYWRLLERLAGEEGDWSIARLDALLRELYAEAGGQPAVAAFSRIQRITAAPSLRHEPFPLTDLQQAYAFGSSAHNPGGAASCLYYREMDVRDLEIGRLQLAWNRVIERHDMLRARFLADGTQQVAEETPEAPIATIDLSACSEASRTQALTELRQQMMQRVAGIGPGPYFTLTISHLGPTLARLHLAIDMMIADGRSIALLLRDLCAGYLDLGALRPRPQVTFRDYAMALQEYRGSTAYRSDLRYWEEKFGAIPAAPNLPLSSADRVANGSGPLIFGARIDSWPALKSAAARAGVPGEVALLTAYLEVLVEWSGGEPAAVVVPCWSRPPVHSDLEEVVGDFTTLCWVSSLAGAHTFAQKTRHSAAMLQQDLSHRGVSGLAALRKVSGRRASSKPAFPVVFTEPLPALEPSALPPGFALGEISSQTPHVYLDNVSTERGATLDLRWYAARNAYFPDMLERMFQGYCRLLKRLGTQPESWEQASFADLINARPEDYRQAARPCERIS
ncbi:MAG: condensation domain-containing protein, partial [Steroidobacteraceae bacterium]